MPTYGAAKRRDMARSVLPSTRAKSARDGKRQVHHEVRMRVRGLIAKGDWDDEADLVLDAQRHKPYQGVKVIVQERREADNIGPLMRWAAAKADEMGDTPAERYAAMRALLPPNLIGWHAMTHVDSLEAYDNNPRRFQFFRRGESRDEWNAVKERRQKARFLAHYEALYLAVTTPGVHKAFNNILKRGWTMTHERRRWESSGIVRWYETCPRCEGAPRLLHGVHDIVPFMEEMYNSERREIGTYHVRAHGKGYENALAYLKDRGMMDPEYTITEYW